MDDIREWAWRFGRVTFAATILNKQAGREKILNNPSKFKRKKQKD